MRRWLEGELSNLDGHEAVTFRLPPWARVREIFLYRDLEYPFVHRSFKHADFALLTVEAFTAAFEHRDQLDVLRIRRLARAQNFSKPFRVLPQFKPKQAASEVRVYCAFTLLFLSRRGFQLWHVLRHRLEEVDLLAFCQRPRALVLGLPACDWRLAPANRLDLDLKVLQVGRRDAFFLLHVIDLHAAKTLVMQVEGLLAVAAVERHVVLGPFILLFDGRRYRQVDLCPCVGRVAKR